MNLRALVICNYCYWNTEWLSCVVDTNDNIPTSASAFFRSLIRDRFYQQKLTVNRMPFWTPIVFLRIFAISCEKFFGQKRYKNYYRREIWARYFNIGVPKNDSYHFCSPRILLVFFSRTSFSTFFTTVSFRLLYDFFFLFHRSTVLFY